MSFAPDLEWYYVTAAGAQAGPIDLAGLRTEFAGGSTNDKCLCWNESMAGWTVIAEVPGLLDTLRPKIPPVAPRPVVSVHTQVMSVAFAFSCIIQ